MSSTKTRAKSQHNQKVEKKSLDKKALKKTDIFSPQNLAVIGIFAALTIVMKVSGIGMIKINALEITTLMVPVILGGILTGKFGGAVLGGVLGAISFSMAFGESVLGLYLLEINPVLTAITMFIPRILAGFLSIVAFQFLSKKFRNDVLICGLTGIIGSVLNTVLYLGFLIGFFHNARYNVDSTDVLIVQEWIEKGLASIILVNALPEAVLCTMVSATVGVTLLKVKKSALNY